MRHRSTMLIVLGMAGLLFGCAAMDYTYGTRVSAQQLAGFIKGTTTRDQVIAALGGPHDLRYEGGKHVLVYRYQRITASPFAPNASSDTIFVFHATGVLEEVFQSQGTGVPTPLTGR